MGTETAGAAFAVHLAVGLKVALEKQLIQRGRNYWELNTTLLQDEEISQRFETEWNKWRNGQHGQNDTTTRRDQYVEKRIRVFFCREGRNKYKDDQPKEKFHYACIYDLLNQQNDIRNKVF
jgi:hypothetical protein